MNLGTNPGYDIESDDGEIICECFASTSPDSNSKLKKDAERLIENNTAAKKYIIFYSEFKKETHVENIKQKYQGINVISLEKLILT